jgi:hypothetical protein
MAGIPRLFRSDQLWEVRDFLSHPRRVLIVAIDAYHKKHVLVHGGDCLFRLSPGALRLAAIVDAVVIPCLIQSPYGLASTIYFGKTVPDDHIADPRNHAAACEHIVREILPILETSPEQCGHYFLNYSLTPTAFHNRLQ